MESLLVGDVGLATSFLCNLLSASSSKIKDVGISHSVIRWANRQVLVHDQELSFFINNKRLLVIVENVLLFADNARSLSPETSVSELSAASIEACLIQGPGLVELSVVAASGDATYPEHVYLAALKLAEDVNSSSLSPTARSMKAKRGLSTTSKGSLASAKDANPPGVKFDTLFPYLFDENTFRPISCNTSKPIPFKTEIFEGVALLLVNSSRDPNGRVDDSDMTFEVQVQGRFTKKPQGRMFIGAQISKKMELGMLTRAMCRTIMNFARSKNPLIHHSFGDDENVEIPHITGPLWSMSDRVVVTPPGETPPSLGKIALPEPIEVRVPRRKDPEFTLEVDTNCTYSFSTNTSNIELVEWCVVNIPLLSKLDLHTFWLDADLLLCAYELDVSSTMAEPFPKLHRQVDCRYCFRLLLKHSSNHPDLSQSDDDEKMIVATASNEDLNNKLITNLANYGRGYETPDQSIKIDSASLESSAELIDEGDPRETMFNDSISGVNECVPAIPTVVISIDPFDEFQYVPVVFEVDDIRKPTTGARRIYYGVQLPADLNAALGETAQGAREGLSLHSYMEYKSQLGALMTYFSKPINYNRLGETEQRRYQLQTLFVNINSKAIEGKLKISEKKKIHDLLSDAKATFEFLDPDKNKDFEYGISSRKHRDGIGATICHSRVCVQLGRFYWSEEYMLLTSRELVFIKPSSKLGRPMRVRIPLKDVIDVSLIPFHRPLFLMPGFELSFLTISTFSKEYTVAVRGHTLRDRWLSSLSSSLDQILSSDVRSRRLSETGEPMVDEMLHVQNMNMLATPKGFDLNGRVVLNCRRFQANPYESMNISDLSIFLPQKTDRLMELEKVMMSKDKGAFTQIDSDAAIAPTSNSLLKGSQLFPSAVDAPYIRDSRYIVSPEIALGIVQEALDLILTISESFGQKDLNNSNLEATSLNQIWINFMNKVSLLGNIELNMKKFNPSGATELALFLNLYHVLVLHSFLAVRIPSSAMNWPGVFNCCSYEAFGDIFSISELEHGVIRGAMSRPSSLIAQMLIPKSNYSFALTVRDKRILFAINCGSQSLLESVPIYLAENIDTQLDFNIRMSLFSQFRMSLPSAIHVPILCMWFQNDLINDSRANSKLAVLESLLPFLGPLDSEELGNFLKSSSAEQITLIYTPFDFRCRLLERQIYPILT